MTRTARTLTGAALGVLLAGAALPVRAATPGEYDRALAEVQAALVRQTQAIAAEEVPSGEAPSLAAQRTLTPIRSVEAPGRLPVPVDPSRLIAAVQAAEAVQGRDAKQQALEAVSGQITLLRSEIAPPPSAPDPAATAKSVRAVLMQKEFASAPPPPPSLADRIAAWMDRVFARRQPASPTVSGPNVNPNVILGILLVIAAAAFAVLVWVLVQALGRRGAKVKPLALNEEEATLVEARDNDSLLALAEQQAKLGEYRRAFRLVYLAALVALDTGGVLRFDRSKTNWEYLRALRAAGRGDIYAALTPLTREFDQVWYGFARADAGHYSRALAQYQALLTAPPAETAAANTRPEATQA